MSIIDEILVLMDDQEELTINQIKAKLPNRTKQIISSALGRLNAKGWVKYKVYQNEKYFKITNTGRSEITKNLMRIKDYEKNDWDGSLCVVVFNIPEKIRKYRDLLRNKLSDLNFFKIQGDLWVTFCDHKKIISDTVNELGIKKYCTIFKIKKLDEEDKKNLINGLIWKKEIINNYYTHFISNAKKFLISKKDGYRARLLVYSYSKILALDPKFPKKFKPKKYLADEAYKYYLKIRPYCYK